ncbi:MAG: creatininase [Candidatus Bathyarchaeia archaeon]
MAKEIFLERMTWKETQQAVSEGYALALIIGSTEQHGPHLPLGTDVYIPLGIAERVASRVNVIIAPPITYGYYSQVRSGGGGERFPGTTSVRSSTLVALTTDIMEASIRHGFRKFMILTGHYENSQLVQEGVQNAMRSSGQNDLRTVAVNWWELIPTKTLNEIYENDFPGWEVEHAAIAETSIMMFLKPELIRTDQIRDYPLPTRLDYDIIPATDEVIPKSGVPWKLSPASKQKGELLVRVAVDRITEIVKRDLK